jgi:hypothetical protein
MLAMCLPCQLTMTPPGKEMRASKGPALRRAPVSDAANPVSVTFVTIPLVKASVAPSTMFVTTEKGRRRQRVEERRGEAGRTGLSEDSSEVEDGLVEDGGDVVLSEREGRLEVVELGDCGGDNRRLQVLDGGENEAVYELGRASGRAGLGLEVDHALDGGLGRGLREEEGELRDCGAKGGQIEGHGRRIATRLTQDSEVDTLCLRSSDEEVGQRLGVGVELETVEVDIRMSLWLR